MVRLVYGEYTSERQTPYGCTVGMHNRMGTDKIISYIILSLFWFGPFVMPTIFFDDITDFAFPGEVKYLFILRSIYDADGFPVVALYLHNHTSVLRSGQNTFGIEYRIVKGFGIEHLSTLGFGFVIPGIELVVIHGINGRI